MRSGVPIRLIYRFTDYQERLPTRKELIICTGVFASVSDRTSKRVNDKRPPWQAHAHLMSIGENIAET